MTERQEAYYDGYEKGFQEGKKQFIEDTDELKDRVKNAEISSDIWMKENKKLDIKIKKLRECLLSL